MIVKRTLEDTIRKYIQLFPIIAVNGPRQSGKTTLLKSAFPEYQYISLENPDIRTIAEADPNSFLEKYSDKIIFDEVQRTPKLFSFLQTKVDNDKIQGQYILSGSQNFHLLQNITQSLAGRVAMFKLFPFDNQELSAADLLPTHFETLITKGFYPALFDLEIPSDIFYQNYIETYIQRDLSELLNIRDLMTFRRFLRLCAGRAGQILNLSALAKDCGISQPTAKSWLSILEGSFVIFLLEPYYENFNKRIIKSPKLYFYDTGLLCYLLNIPDATKFSENRMMGNIFENFIIADLQKENAHHYSLQNFWFWRDSNGNEVDLISEGKGNLKIAEIKSTKTISDKLFSGLHYFSKTFPLKIDEKWLIYGGETSIKKNNIEIISWRNNFM
ncbi:ATP-binding protein [Chryseobacterium sp. MDT2-18]|uniref:ATP-binding protein n=1 Tax=Chryseobacterium sp. MDT2-18 TaxID=1259136 RepID=UPI00278B0D3E|nr:ATP-binding protein [Chryseobacterium sp. MDT2-18]MDQ0476753.1 putative AAA+ superfamily ATPase [Chryseobacterium sp. MDT2-18]